MKKIIVEYLISACDVGIAYLVNLKEISAKTIYTCTLSSTQLITVQGYDRTTAAAVLVTIPQY